MDGSSPAHLPLHSGLLAGVTMCKASHAFIGRLAYLRGGQSNRAASRRATRIARRRTCGTPKSAAFRTLRYKVYWVPVSFSRVLKKVEIRKCTPNSLDHSDGTFSSRNGLVRKVRASRKDADR